MTVEELHFFNTTTKFNGDDEGNTVDLEESDDGYTVNDDDMGTIKRHPRDRRKRSERLAILTLVGFFIVIFIALIPLYDRKKNRVSLKGEGSNSLEEGVVGQKTVKKKVFCSGRLTYTLDEWLDEEVTNTAQLCDPAFKPESGEADMSKPVKVFVLLGEANMVGTGQTNGDVPGTLEYTVKTKKRFTHLVDSSKAWKARPDVRYVAVKDDKDIQRNDWLAVDENHHFFGPELQFGYILGELFDEPVLLIKACSGHQSMGGDLLPPGSSQFEFGGWVYPGYGESPRRWQAGSEAESTSWHAGHAYDTALNNIKYILSNLGDYYPGGTDYEIAGIAFWQGDSDRHDTAYASRYQRNLRTFIASIRHDLGVPDAKVAIASLGQRGMEMTGNALSIFESQLAMGTLYRDFQDTVMSVDIRSSWRTAYLPGYDGDDSMKDVSHYGNNAETVMEVGNALGLAMAKLLMKFTS